MTNDEENNNEKEESLIDAGMSNTEKESCTIDYFSTDGCHGDGGWCRTNYVYKSYRVINGLFRYVYILFVHMMCFIFLFTHRNNTTF